MCIHEYYMCVYIYIYIYTINTYKLNIHNYNSLHVHNIIRVVTSHVLTYSCNDIHSTCNLHVHSHDTTLCN